MITAQAILPFVLLCNYMKTSKVYIVWLDIIRIEIVTILKKTLI